MSAVDDAAILYFAINGWGPPLTCSHFVSDAHGDRCDAPMVGINADDGSPLCEEHLVHPEEDGHRLDPAVLRAIAERRAEAYRNAGEEVPT